MMILMIHHTFDVIWIKARADCHPLFNANYCWFTAEINLTYIRYSLGFPQDDNKYEKFNKNEGRLITVEYCEQARVTHLDFILFLSFSRQQPYEF